MPYLADFELQERIDELRGNLHQLKPEDRVPYYVAHQLIRSSAWWLKHPKGPVRAPKHADNLTEHPKYGGKFVSERTHSSSNSLS